MSMSKTALPAKMRTLKAQQIGLSNHKNEYTTGTLCNNWNEERNATEYEKIAPKPSFIPQTTTSATFKAPQQNKLQPAVQRDFEITDDIEKHILLGHGTNPIETSYVSMNQLVHSNPFVKQGVDANLKTEKAFKVLPQNVKTSLLQQKTQQWQEEIQKLKTPDDTYSKSSSLYGQGAYSALKNQEPKKTAIWGEATSHLDHDYLKMNLRETK